MLLKKTVQVRNSVHPPTQLSRKLRSYSVHHKREGKRIQFFRRDLWEQTPTEQHRADVTYSFLVTSSSKSFVFSVFSVFWGGVVSYATIDVNFRRNEPCVYVYLLLSNVFSFRFV